MLLPSLCENVRSRIKSGMTEVGWIPDQAGHDKRRSVFRSSGLTDAARLSRSKAEGIEDRRFSGKRSRSVPKT